MDAAILGPVFSLTMLGSGSAGNSALVATDHGKVLVDGGLSARQVVLRLEQCGVDAGATRRRGSYPRAHRSHLRP